jgi:outer membrane cobalamin receptor
MSLARLLIVSIALLAASASLRAAPAPGDDVTPVTRDLRSGDSVASVLNALNARGHRVVYSSALVKPGMKLAAVPRATDIRSLLGEVLGPWRLKAVRAAEGDWLVVNDPAAREVAPASSTPAATSSSETLETVDVTASRFSLASVESSQSFLNRHEVERMPHLADDAMRMLQVLPGVSGGDFSAALNIRGGRRDETLLIIDGAEVHNGFHFRDLDGALSVIDTHVVQGIDFTTGGITAERGDVMSGVVDMHTRRPTDADEHRSVVGVSFVSLYGRTGGTFGEGRGSWLAAARRGYLDVLMKQVVEEGETLTPRYSDLFASVDYDVDEGTRISGRLMLGTDELRLVTSDDADDLDSAGSGDGAHAWVTLDHAFSDALRSVTTLSSARVTTSRDSAGEDEERRGDVQSDFEFEFVDLRQETSWTLNTDNLVRFGANAGHATADYFYRLDGAIFDPLAPGGEAVIQRAADLDVRGDKIGAFAAWRASWIPGVVSEIGLRYDRHEYPDGLTFSSTSPRVNAVWRLGERAELRAAWGVLHQAQGIDALQVEDGVTQFFEPERARHSLLGFTQRFAAGISARLDVYRKDYTRLRPRFENALDRVQLIPEGAVDRVRIDAGTAESSGVELTLRREAERGWAGWISVAAAKARDRDAAGWTPRLWEQRRTLSFGTSWTAAAWNVSLAGLFHDGTPTTRLGPGLVTLPDGTQRTVVLPGPRNAERLAGYSRVDLRANRDVPLKSGKLSFYLEVTNLLNQENPCCIEGGHMERQGAQTYLVFEETNWLPMLPSFGVQYEF